MKNEIENEESPFKPEYLTYIDEYTGRGTLKIQVSVADGSFPLKGAAVNVAKLLNGHRYLLYSDTTDLSGIVNELVLPALPREDSLKPETANGGAEYLVSIFHPSFKDIIDCPVTVYDKVETIFPASPEPLNAETEAENG